MNNNETPIDITRLLYLGVLLWAGYLLALALIDHIFYPRPVFSPAYYLVNGLDILMVWGIVIVSQKRPRWRQPFLPLIILLLSVPPVVMAQLVTKRMPPIQASGPEAVLLRTMPFLLLSLILTAWRYGWRYVLLFSSNIAAFTMALHLYFYRPGRASLLPPLVTLLIQTISFLVTGYFISMLLKRLQQEQVSLAKANAQLTHYASTLEELTISRERNRMARELHDTLAHTLSGLSVQLETAKAYWDVDPATAQRLLDQSLTATRSGLQETRRTLKSLRASPLDDLGLRLAIRQLAESTAERADLHLAFILPPSLPSLSPTVEQTIYRVAQEAIANVAHHANAQVLNVNLTYSDAHIILSVQDDGLGFDPQQPEQTGHYGLAGMRERAQLVGGKLTIESKLKQGTAVKLVIKLEKVKVRGKARMQAVYQVLPKDFDKIVEHLEQRG